MRTHYLVPEPTGGYELNQEDGRGYWSIIRPKATRNLIVNPSFELDTYGWALGPTPHITFSRSNDVSIFGAYAVKIIGKDVSPPELSYIWTSLTEWEAGQPLTVSAYGISQLKALNETALRVEIILKTGTTIRGRVISNPLKSSGRWYRVHTSILVPDFFRANVPDNTIEIRLYHGGGKGDIVYWDAIQAENLNVPTTYADGDMVGFQNEGFDMYCWQGGPHRSISTRSGRTRSGGEVVNLSDIGVRLLQMEGIGLPEIDDVSTAHGMLPGLLYQQSAVRGREMVLSGYVCGEGYHKVREQIFELHKLIAPNVARRNGQTKLRFSQSDCCDDTLEIVTAYDSGLEGEVDDLYQIRFAMSLIAHQPFFNAIGERGQALPYSKQMGISHIIQRRGNGEWDDMDGGLSLQAGTGREEVRKVLWVNNRAVAFGNFNTGGSPGNSTGVTLNKLALFDDDNGWQDIFPSITYLDLSDIIVWDMVALPSGKLVFTGYDTGLGGTAVWSTDVTLVTDCDYRFNQLGSHIIDGTDNTWYALAVDQRGYIYAGGNRGVISRWDGYEWSDWREFPGEIRDMAFDTEGNLYVVGWFDLPIERQVSPVPTDILFVPVWEWKTLTYELAATPQQVVLKQDFDTGDVYIVLIAAINEDPDDPISTYDWEVVETGATFSGRLVKIDLTARPEETTSTIRLTVTTTNGLTLSNDIAYYKDDGLTQIQALTTNETITQNSEVVTVSPDAIIHDETDPVVTYAWSNDQTVDTFNTQTADFDFSSLIVGTEIVITLTVTTLYNGSNTNSIKLIKTIDGLEEIEADATNDINQYIKTNEAGEFIEIYICRNGYIIGLEQCIVDLDVSYAVAIGPDGRAYIGTKSGLYVWSGYSAEQVGNPGAVTSLAISENTGEVYIGGRFGLLKWNGYNIVSSGIRFGSNVNVNSIAIGKCDDSVVIGMEYYGGVSVSGNGQVYYPGTAEARPSFRFFGPGQLHEITNHTLNQSIYIDHFVQYGEIVDLEFKHGGVRFSSNYWGDIPIQPGTSANFFLEQGDNDFSVWIENGMPYCTDAVAIFPLLHISSDALCSPEAYTRFPTDVPELCCYDRTTIFGNQPSNECNNTPCGSGSQVIDLIKKQVWVLVDCGQEVEDVCASPTCFYVDDTPDNTVSYDGFLGTTVVDPVQRLVSVLVGCDDNLTDSEDVDLLDSEGVLIT